MPQTKQNIRRLCSIYEILCNYYYPSKRKIKHILEDTLGCSYSDSCIEKDLFSLKIDFDINLFYNRKYQGYELIDSNPSLFIYNLFEYLELNELNVIKNSLLIKELYNYEKRITA